MDINEVLGPLRKTYRNKLPDKFSEIEQLYSEIILNWSELNYRALLLKVHRLGGSAGTYGFLDVSIRAKELEQFVREFCGSKDGLNETRIAEGREILNSLRKNIDQAPNEL